MDHHDAPRPAPGRPEKTRLTSRVVRPDSDKYTGQAPPEEIDSDEPRPAPTPPRDDDEDDS